MSDQNHFDKECIINAVLSFINAKTWAESKAIVQAHHDDLLTPAAVQVFEVLLMQHKDDESAIRILEEHCSLLRRCQSEGIDAAFAGRLQAQSLHEIPPELLAQLRSVRTDAELRELIEEHPELLPVRALGSRSPEIYHSSGSGRVRGTFHYVNVQICRLLDMLRYKMQPSTVSIPPCISLLFADLRSHGFFKLFRNNSITYPQTRCLPCLILSANGFPTR